MCVGGGGVGKGCTRGAKVKEQEQRVLSFRVGCEMGHRAAAAILVSWRARPSVLLLLLWSWRHTRYCPPLPLPPDRSTCVCVSHLCVVLLLLQLLLLALQRRQGLGAGVVNAQGGLLRV